MTWLVVLFGVWVIGLGVWGLARPEAFLEFVRRTLSGDRGMEIAVGVRVVLGAILLLTADDTRFPTVMLVLGAIALVAAAVLPFLGRERLTTMVDWWLERPPAWVRAWMLWALAFGGFLVWAALP